MRHYWGLLLLLLVAPPVVAQVDGLRRGALLACPGAITVGQREIEAAGAVYLSDLLRLLPPIRRTSVDGAAWRFTGGSNVPGEAAFPVVLVDGVPARLGFLGWPDVEELPLPLTSIARFVYCPVPTPVAGQWAGAGALHFFTRRRGEGLHAQVGWQIGNETGDPGPYRYTERATSNVDRIGQDFDGELGYEAPQFGGSGRFRALQTHASDVALRPRTGAVTERASRGQDLAAAEVEVAVGHGTRHALQLGGRYVSHLPFLEPVGRELPLRRLDGYVGAQGPLLASLRYSLGAHSQRVDDVRSRLAGFDPRWSYRALTAAVYGGAPATAGWHYGASLARTDASSAGIDAGFTLGTLYGTLVRSGPAFSHRMDLALTSAGDDIGAKVVQVVALALRRAHVAFTLALDRRVPEENPGYGFWRAHSLAGFEGGSVAYVSAVPVPRVGASMRLDGRFGLESAELNGGLRVGAARGVFVERPSLRLAEDASTTVGVVTAVPEAAGSELGAWVGAVYEFGLWRGEVSYSFLAPLRGSGAFDAAWARVPRHRAVAAVTLRPDATFSARASLDVRSATRWPGYAAVDGGATPDGYIYTDGTPPLTLLDLAVGQWLWDRRVRVSLLFRNLLNTEERYHPLGGALDFRLYARVTAELSRR